VAAPLSSKKSRTLHSVGTISAAKLHIVCPPLNSDEGKLEINVNVPAAFPLFQTLGLAAASLCMLQPEYCFAGLIDYQSLLPLSPLDALTGPQ